MSNTVKKSRFAGLLRGLLGRKDTEATSAEAELRPVTAAAPAPPDGLTDSSAPAPFATAPETTNENEIALPLEPVLAALTLELRAKVISVPPPGASIRVAVDTVVPQLAFGVVKISFGDLRHLSPGVFSNASSSELDGRPVSLPLKEILACVHPSLLARREAEQVQVNEDIKGPFANRGQGVSFTEQPLKAPAPKPASRITAGGTEIFTRGSVSLPAHAAQPASAPSTPIPFRAVTPTPNKPITSITGNGHAGINGFNGANGSHGANGVKNGNGANGQHPPITPHIPMSAAVPAPKPAAPVLPSITVVLADLAENWPDEIKDEIARAAIANVNLPLPGKIVDDGLKRGRLTLTWKQIRLLAKPSATPSPNDGLELELPLPVIAPLFLAAKKTPPTAKKSVSVSSDIPNLFFGFPQAAPHTPPPAPQRLAMSNPPAAKLPTAFAPPPEKNNGNSNFYVWGDGSEAPSDDACAPPPVPETDFTSRRAMPKEVVERAMAFRGVAGALVTLPDGLRVASDVPAPFNADTLAAFIPQLFERMNQSARELRMGALNNVSFTVGNVPWRIFRVNSVYLAAFGRPGESLPAADLAGLAGELDRKQK